MNSRNWKLFAVAATLAVAGTTASAQLTMKATLKAAVPFSFTAGSARVLQAGSYNLRHEGNLWYFSNNETLQGAASFQRAATQSGWNEKPSLVFHCRAKGCSLYAIQAGNGGRGAYFGEPKRSKAEAAEEARVVIVPLTTANAD